MQLPFRSTFAFILVLLTFTCKAQVVFKNLDSLAVGLVFHASVSDGKSLYAINGQYWENKRNVVSPKIYRYDTLSAKWSVFSEWLIPKVQSIAEYIPSTGKIYMIGGGRVLDYKSFFDGVETIDVKTGKIEKLPVVNPFPTYYAGSAVWKDKIYIFGGSTLKGVASNKFYEFDPKDNSFNALPDMPEGKQVAGKIVNGVLYTFGGYNELYKLPSDLIEAYNISSRTWTRVGKLPIPVSANAVAVYGDLIFVAGSYGDLHFFGYFDTKTKKFTQLSSTMLGRRHAGIGVLQDKLYLFGGNSSNIAPWLKSTQVAGIKGVK